MEIYVVYLEYSWYHFFYQQRYKAIFGINTFRSDILLKVADVMFLVLGVCFRKKRMQQLTLMNNIDRGSYKIFKNPLLEERKLSLIVIFFGEFTPNIKK
jgi:hypothetical protein